LTVVDDANRPVVVLSPNNGSPGIFLYDKQQQTREELFLEPNGTPDLYRVLIHRKIFIETDNSKHLPARRLEVKVRIGYVEHLDAERENFLLHLIRAVGLEFQKGCFQKLTFLGSATLPDEAEMRISELKPVHFIVLNSRFAPFCSPQFVPCIIANCMK